MSPLARCVQLSLPLRNRGKLALKLAHIFLGSADLAAAVPIFEDTPDFCSKLSIFAIVFANTSSQCAPMATVPASVCNLASMSWMSIRFFG